MLQILPGLPRLSFLKKDLNEHMEVDKQIFTSLQKVVKERKIPEILKDRLFLNIVVVVVVLLFSGVLFFTLVLDHSKKDNDLTAPELALQEKDPTKYFDATAVSFDKAKNTLYMEITKDGFTTRVEQKLSPNIKINKVVYDPETKVINSKKSISSSELQTGQPLRLFVKKANTDFDLKTLTEIQILEGQ